MRIFFILLLMILCGSLRAQYYADADSAFAYSEKTQLPVLIVFTGSDWCANCMRFEKMVLENEVFHKFAGENLIIVRADFPQRGKQPKDLRQQNEKLAEVYNAEGVFPHFVLLAGQSTKPIPMRSELLSPEIFISELESLLRTP